MSKSLNNYIGIDESADDIFGKVMSISDETMWGWYPLISFRSLDEIKTLQDQVAAGANPRDIKFLLAEEIVARFHGEAAAKVAHANFIARFQKGHLPDDMPFVKLENAGKAMAVAQVMKMAKLVDSTSEAIRLIQQGGVRVNDERIEDKNYQIEPKRENILQVGKRRFAKVIIS